MVMLGLVWLDLVPVVWFFCIVFLLIFDKMSAFSKVDFLRFYDLGVEWLRLI